MLRCEIVYYIRIWIVIKGILRFKNENYRQKYTHVINTNIKVKLIAYV